MVKFPTWILDCGSQYPALLDLFLSSEVSICSTMAFPIFGNSDHIFVSVFTDFSSNSQWDVPFHHIVYDYSHADWDYLCSAASRIFLLEPIVCLVCYLISKLKNSKNYLS